ncbi:hypothetical protein F5Y04DRAFT_275437 [Hypomontagnella monticulosa]|nr:hypothetical protein F5Y04DRAFT_275437 [Hypomontagnella monticulosa]
MPPGSPPLDGSDRGQSQSQSLSLSPDLGLPLEHEQPYMKFSYSDMQNCSVGFESKGLTQREIRMMDFMNRVTDKPSWEEKIFDSSIVSEWLEEGRSASTNYLDGDEFFSKSMYDICIRELRDKAEHMKATGIVNVMDAEMAIAKSDTIISPPLANSLKAAVQVLEDALGDRKDWHPSSDNKVLNLLHPSLYPLIFGTTRVLPYDKIPLDTCAQFICEGEATTEFENYPLAGPMPWGLTQWLPSDIEWTETGPRIVSYINSLHPEDHMDLYKVLEKFVAAAVTMWEECLFPLPQGLPPRIPWRQTRGIDDSYLLKGMECKVPDEFIIKDSESPEDKNNYEHSIKHRERLRENTVLRWPEPEDYYLRKRCPGNDINFKKDFPSGIQIIFKLSNIQLTPEKPNYDGGPWHVDGALNDSIIATALYYYEMENITESRLTFRHPVDEIPLNYAEQEGKRSLWRWLGLPEGYELSSQEMQEIGSVLARPGRFLTFPNAFQHRIEPFQLQDPTKPGHRKILAMYLVNPGERILSTSVVPPQQKDWWVREVRKIPPFSDIPMEIFFIIVDFVEGYLIDWEEALEVRQRFMRTLNWTYQV